MCTAITVSRLFGRTLDLEYSYDEKVAVTPRKFRFDFRHCEPLSSHYAIIGMATVCGGYPLYYDAMNEKGLCMAGLNFPVSNHYFTKTEGMINVASFEFIPFVLGQCESLDEAEKLISKINICPDAFDKRLPASPLHWAVADGERMVVVESMADGLHLYKNNARTLTNEPPLAYQLARLSEYAGLSAAEPSQSHFERLGAKPYSRGLGLFGLPGDFSSPSRFVRAAILLENSDFGKDGVNQFFRVLGGVEVPRGCVRLADGERVITHYTSCMDVRNGVYYYKTYENSRISAVDMNAEDLDGKEVTCFSLNNTTDIFPHNFSLADRAKM